MPFTAKDEAFSFLSQVVHVPYTFQVYRWITLFCLWVLVSMNTFISMVDQEVYVIDSGR